MHTVKLNSKVFYLPEHRDELTPKQVQKVIFYLGSLDTSRNRFRLLAHLHPQFFKRLKKVDPHALYEIGKLIAWTFELKEMDGAEEVKPLVKGFKHKGTWYQLPQESFYDVVGDEYAHIELAVSGLKDNFEEKIHELTAIIARPLRPKKERKVEDFDGYARQYFNPETVGIREKTLKGVKPWVYGVVKDFVLRAQELIAIRYAEVFSGGEGEGSSLGWEGMFMSIAESGIFGNVQAVKRTNVHDLLFFTLKRERERKKRELELNRIKNQKKRR